MMVARCFVFACLFNPGQTRQCEGDVCHDQENVEAASGSMLLHKRISKPLAKVALGADSEAPQRDSINGETDGDDQKALSHDESHDAANEENVAAEESGSNVTAMKLQLDLDRQFCQDQPLTEAGWDNVQSHCCMYVLDLFSRRMIEQLGLDICEEGRYNGFFPLFHCLSDGTTLEHYKSKIIENQGELCFAPRGQCDVGPPRDCSEFARDGPPINPAWHRRRRCGTAATTTTTTGLPSATTVTTTTISNSDRVCGLPARVKDFSLIVLNDATVNAHEIYSGLAIGGNLYDGTPSQTTNIHGASFVLNVIPGNWNFKGGVSRTEALSDVFDWSHFEWLAQNMKSVYEGNWRVRVFKEGGTYSANGQPSWGLNFFGQGEDNGNTLLVFQTNEDIRLIGSTDGRQFGPSVLAPFSVVTLDGSAGFADGFIIAKQFGPSGTFPSAGNNAGQLQFHGDGYKGPIECKDIA